MTRAAQRRGGSGVALLVVLLVTAGAAAQSSRPPLARAELHFKAAVQLGRAGQLADARLQAAAARQLLVGLVTSSSTREPAAAALLCQVIELERTQGGGAPVPELVRSLCTPRRGAAPAPAGAPTAPAAAPTPPSAEAEGEGPAAAAPSPRYPTLFAYGQARAPHARAAERHLLLGRFAEAVQELEASLRDAPDPAVDEALALARPLARAAAALEGEPELAAAALAEALGRRDPALAQEVQQIAALTAGGRTREAARIASATAARFEASVAALVLRLPAVLLAARYQRRTIDLLQHGEYGAALGPAVDARRLAPGLEELLGAWALARSLRVIELRRGAAAVEASHPALAYAFWLGIAAASGEQREDVKAALHRLEPEVRRRVAYTLALTDASDEPYRRRGLVARLRPLLQARLRSHVTLAADGTSGAREITLGFRGPLRVATATVEPRTKQVAAYSVTVPNPAWSVAAKAYNEAIGGIRDARQARIVLQYAADQLAGAHSIPDLIRKAAAVAALTAGFAKVKSAENTLRKRGAALRATPRTITAPAMVDATYFAVVTDVEAQVKLLARWAGLGASTTRELTYSARRRFESICAAPEIGVAERPLDRAAVEALAPELDAELPRLAEVLAAVLRATDDQRLWAAAQAAERTGDVRRAARRYAEYLVGAGHDPAKARLARAFIRERLR